MMSGDTIRHGRRAGKRPSRGVGAPRAGHGESEGCPWPAWGQAVLCLRKVLPSFRSRQSLQGLWRFCLLRLLFKLVAGRLPKLSIHDRQPIERKLTRWLIDHHQAIVFREFSELPPREFQDVHIVVGCQECKGSGKQYGSERCRSCLGNGTVWVVTLK